jgi:hypothetical protein
MILILCLWSGAKFTDCWNDLKKSGEIFFLYSPGAAADRNVLKFRSKLSTISEPELRADTNIAVIVKERWKINSDDRKDFL